MQIEDILAAKKPASMECPVVLDQTLLDQVAAATTALEEVQRKADRQGLSAAKRKLHEAERRCEEGTAKFHFEAVGRLEWEQLRDDHQPTDEQVEDWQRTMIGKGVSPSEAGRPPWNHETFPPTAIAASCVDPKMSVEQARALWDSPRFGAAELDKLFSAAVMVNTTSRQVSLGNVSGRTAGYATS